MCILCRYLFADHNITMTSIEPDAKAAIYGSSHHHIVDVVQNLMRYVQPGAFDVAVLNGIIGFGLNEDNAIKEAAIAMHQALRPGGLLVIGYNLGISSCCHQFEEHFVPTMLGKLPQKTELTNSPMHHIYTLYRKR